ncbi:glycosyltransferase [Salegentibacter sediminis]|uniref:glycosyltransferase n=1 Tax=Salegentibacter sediminis TaxID=1930251 RepID=UPI0009BEF8AD|nr:glycosyltransferase [Salegentibacter sediminis]
MKVLIVHSGTQNKTSAYIKEQVDSLISLGLEINYFTITKKGVKGYLSHLPKLYKKINEFKPDIIHAHYGISGLFANLQRKIPVITSFHGSDVYKSKNVVLSKIAYYLSKETIFVSSKLKTKFGVKRGNIITCGVDMNLFKPASPLFERESIILFSGSADNKVKNYPLANEGVKIFNNHFVKCDLHFRLTELKNKSRKEVVHLMNTAQLLLITSIYEGSSQVLKEAMACNCPVVTTNVGSVRDLISKESKAGIIVEPFPESIANGIHKVLSEDFKHGRKELVEYEIGLGQVAQRILMLYNKVASNSTNRS